MFTKQNHAKLALYCDNQKSVLAIRAKTPIFALIISIEETTKTQYL
jgi:hypothetical protein